MKRLDDALKTAALVLTSLSAGIPCWPLAWSWQGQPASTQVPVIRIRARCSLVSLLAATLLSSCCGIALEALFGDIGISPCLFPIYLDGTCHDMMAACLGKSWVLMEAVKLPTACPGWSPSGQAGWLAYVTAAWPGFRLGMLFSPALLLDLDGV